MLLVTGQIMTCLVQKYLRNIYIVYSRGSLKVIWLTYFQKLLPSKSFHMTVEPNYSSWLWKIFLSPNSACSRPRSDANNWCRINCARFTVMFIPIFFISWLYLIQVLSYNFFWMSNCSSLDSLESTFASFFLLQVEMLVIFDFLSLMSSSFIFTGCYYLFMSFVVNFVLNMLFRYFVNLNLHFQLLTFPWQLKKSHTLKALSHQEIALLWSLCSSKAHSCFKFC